MLSKELIRDFIHTNDLGRKDILYIILWINKEEPQTLEAIRNQGKLLGFPEILKWNLNDYFNKSKSYVTRLPSGYLLTSKGNKYVEGILPKSKTSTKNVAYTLQSYLTKVQDLDTKNFLEEAINCLEYDLYRASVVLSWVGAIALLYDYVIKNKLADFNSEASKRNTKWKNAKTKDDLTKIKESDFLDILAAISVIGKNVKEQLKKSLDLRNACGHPNSLKIGKHTVEAHLETLILNVFQKY